MSALDTNRVSGVPPLPDFPLPSLPSPPVQPPPIRVRRIFTGEAYDRTGDEDLRFFDRPIRELNLNGNNTRIRTFGSLRNMNVSHLEQLSMVNMRMIGLHKVPQMPRLENLDLSNNRISENLHKLNVCPKLMQLNLSRNKIKTIETLEPLKNLKYLRSLDLFGNDVIFVDNYRQKVFNLIKSLKYLDGSIKEIEEE